MPGSARPTELPHLKWTPSTGFLGFVEFSGNPHGKQRQPRPLLTYEHDARSIELKEFATRGASGFVRNLLQLEPTDVIQKAFITRTPVLTVPSELVAECAGSACESCPLWLMCSTRHLDFGELWRVTIDPVHLAKRLRRPGEIVPSISFKIETTQLIKEAQSPYFPQTHKDKAPM